MLSTINQKFNSWRLCVVKNNGEIECRSAGNLISAHLSRYNWPVILSVTVSDICSMNQLHKGNLMISRPSFAAGNERHKVRTTSARAAAVPLKPQNRLYSIAREYMQRYTADCSREG